MYSDQTDTWQFLDCFRLSSKIISKGEKRHGMVMRANIGDTRNSGLEE